MDDNFVSADKAEKKDRKDFTFSEVLYILMMPLIVIGLIVLFGFQIWWMSTQQQKAAPWVDTDSAASQSSSMTLFGKDDTIERKIES